MDCIPSDVEHSPESKKDEDGLREDGEGTIETADLGLWDGFNGFVKSLLILICWVVVLGVRGEEFAVGCLVTFWRWGLLGSDDLVEPFYTSEELAVN